MYDASQDSQKQSRIFTCARDGTCNVWKFDDFTKINGYGVVHKGGVLSGEIVGNVWVTSGEDLLVKLHTL